MPVTIVSRWKGKQEEVLRNAKEAKPILLRNGAADVRFSQVYTGDWSGQWIVAVVYADWATYGKAMQANAQDNAFQKMMTDALRTTEFVDRNLLVGVEI